LPGLSGAWQDLAAAHVGHGPPQREGSLTRPSWCRIAAAAAALLVSQGARAEDVQWIWPAGWLPSPAPREAAVLGQSLLVDGGAIRRFPRRRPLVVPPGTRITPVVHVQVSPETSALAPGAARAIAEEVLRARAESTSGWVQLDFEAPPAQREDWRRLVAELRRTLPATVRLSVTALASWCAGGAWLDGLAADEVVPMFFRMGPGGDAWRAELSRRPLRLHPRCLEGAIGASPQEPLPAVVLDRYSRRYWFDQRPANLATAMPTP
jgi:hypothetical protein